MKRLTIRPPGEASLPFDAGDGGRKPEPESSTNNKKGGPITVNPRGSNKGRLMIAKRVPHHPEEEISFKTHPGDSSRPVEEGK